MEFLTQFNVTKQGKIGMYGGNDVCSLIVNAESLLLCIPL